MMRKVGTILACLTAATMLTGCFVADATGPHTWSVTVETSEMDRHGILYDYDPNQSIALGMVIINGVPVSFYPDLHLLVVSEEGVEEGDETPLTSDCEDNVLKCEVALQVPDGYFALILLDLDVEAVDRHDYVDGLIFTDRTRGAIDPDRAAAVEAHARAWMEAKVEGVPSRPFNVVRRGDCREVVCAADRLSGTASFEVVAMPPMPAPPPAPESQSDRSAECDTQPCTPS